MKGISGVIWKYVLGEYNTTSTQRNSCIEWHIRIRGLMGVAIIIIIPASSVA